jgi:transcriptional regulator with XRE-family HTH domain
VLLMEAHRQSTASNLMLAVMAKTPKARHWDQLRALRKRLKLSQEKFAERIGMTQGMISQLENGTADYTRTHLEAIARAFDVDPADLVARDADSPHSIYGLINNLPEADRPRAIELLQALNRTASR